MSERIPLSKKLRFEIFKRDSFTCQYCGAKAPAVVLECDHIIPVAEGGGNEPLNLATSCAACNSGKGARVLSDDHVVAKQRVQLDEINERRVQLEMLADWQKEISDAGDDAVDQFGKIWSTVVEGQTSLTPHGRDLIKKWLRKFSPEEIAIAMRESAASYLTRGPDGALEFASIEKAFDYVPRVASVRKTTADKPYMQRLYYIRGILRRRLNYLRDQDCLELMEEAVESDIDLDWLEGFAKRTRSWSAFRRSLEQFIEEQRNG